MDINTPKRAPDTDSVPRSVSILGSTGSVGCNTVELLENHTGDFVVEALTANKNVQLLADQARRLKPRSAVVADPNAYTELKDALAGTDVTVAVLAPGDLVRRGIIQVMEGRRCFPHLTVHENLLTGSYTRKDGKAAVRSDLERVYAHFPPLAERRRILAGFISGGEQQMLAIGRSLMSRPTMVLLDEPSMGLAPQVVARIFAEVRQLNKEEGVTFLLAEQNANMALGVAGYGYILDSGQVVLEGTAAELRGNPAVREHYLGLSQATAADASEGDHAG